MKKLCGAEPGEKRSRRGMVEQGEAAETAPAAVMAGDGERLARRVTWERILVGAVRC